MSLPRLRPLPLRRLMTSASALAVAAGLATVVPSGAAEASVWPGHPDRSLVTHTVRAGETPAGLAVRYHAWTAELVRLNHVRGGRIYQGQVLRIPVVLSAVRRAQGSSSSTSGSRPTSSPIHATTPPRGWGDADLSREQVRGLVTAIARHYGVPSTLALAIAWQESGWQQRRVSSTGALGVMQVMPDTGRWMRLYAGRPLRLRDTHDNIQAGVLTLRYLRSATYKDRRAIAAYYQGLGAVRQHGLYDDTERYVEAVRSHERQLRRTGNPV